MMRRTSSSVRAGCSSLTSTTAWVAAMPARFTFAADSVKPVSGSPDSSLRSSSTPKPASSIAPNSMSPLTPEKQSR